MKVCRKRLKADKKQKTKSHQANIIVEENNNSDDDNLYNIHWIQQQANPPVRVELNINNKPIVMEVDTGASVSLINVSMFNQIKNQNDSIFLTKSKLRTYTSEVVTPTGEVKVNTEYKNQSLCIPVIVMKNRPNLSGRDILKILQSNWFELFNIYVSEISAVYENESLKKILSDYKEIFKPELGTLKGVEITLYVDRDAKPHFCRARPAPYALKDRIEKELERLVSEDIYDAIPPSKWTAPIVPVIKNDGCIRICGDYKQTINRMSECDRYPVLHPT